MSELTARLFVLLQKLAPKYVLTSLVFRLARVRNIAIKNYLIRQFVNFYNVDIEEVVRPVPDGFATFNDFFIRELTDDARRIDSADDSIVAPVDGTVSAAGRIDREKIFQAKGLSYTVTDLLATDIEEAERFIDGAYVTIYLAPYDYHRVHAPIDGEIVAMRYVPGDLFSVNDATVRWLPGLFTRNERLVCHLITNSGPMILIFIGALNVGTINTRWTGDVRPRRKGVVDNIDLRRHVDDLRMVKGDLLGWFNMGSTVVLLLPPDISDAFAGLQSGQTVRMGRPIASLATTK